MKRIPIIGLAFLCLPGSAQNLDSDVRTTFSISGGAGLRQFSPAPAVQNKGLYVIDYKGKPERTGWCGCQYFAMDEQGEIVEVKFDEYNADLHTRFGVFARDGSGWLFDAAYTFSRYSYAYANIPFPFKNYTLSVRNSDLESNGLSFGIARFWRSSLFARFSGVYFYRYTTGAFDKPVDEAYKLNFTENGTGYLVSIADRSENNVAVIPEFGLTSSRHPVELSISAVLPVSRYAMSERYSYYRNRVLLGEAVASYSTMSFSINVRIGLTLFRTYRRTHTVQPNKHAQPESGLLPISNTPIPEPRQNTSVDPAPIHQSQSTESRFATIPMQKSVRLLVNFEQSTAILLTDSYADLDQLVQWMSTNPSARIRLEGHTDLPGEVQKNLDLSRRRVVAVKDYLSKRGVSSYRVETTYFGNSRPLNRNCPPPNYCPENRRVELIIINR